MKANIIFFYMEAKPLYDFLNDLPLGETHKELKTRLTNVIEIFNKPFDPDIVYELFENCYEVLDYYKIKKLPNAVFYSCDDGETYKPFPSNIEEFLWDCEKYWKKKLFWEKSLLKSKFEKQIH